MATNNNKMKKQKSKDRLSVFVILLKAIPMFLFWLLIAAVILIIVVALSSLPYITSFQTMAAEALAGKDSLQNAQQLINQQQFLAAYDDLIVAQNHFDNAQEELDSLKSTIVFRLPGIKNQFEIADDILTIGSGLSGAVADTVLFANDILDITGQSSLNFAQISSSQKHEILQRLVSLGLELETTKQEISQIQLAWTSLTNRTNLYLWQPVIDPLEEQLPQIFEIFDYIILASDTVPQLVGYDEEKTYLFLLQNNNEIRPAGGFIGTYGIVKVRDAELVSFQTDNIYNLDVNAIDRLKIEAPYPITTYMGVDYWYMRDSNWWPDFPTSARKVEEFYHLEQGPEQDIDGIIAINPDFIEDLLSLVGPIQVLDINFNKDNFTQELQYQVEFGYYKRGIAHEERKEIIGELASKLESRIYNLPADQWKVLLDVVRDNLQRKHILSYFKDIELQQLVEKEKWAGQVLSTSEDYLQVVDANLAALKTDAVMQRKIDYSLRPDNGDLYATAQITYEHNGWFDDFTTRYRSYTRLYVPEGSELQNIKINGQDFDLNKVDIYEEFDKTAFGLFFEVEPGQSKAIAFEYILPERILKETKDGEYTLTLQKQPGIRELNVGLDLIFPDKLKVFGSEQVTNKISYSEKITKDQIYTVLFE